MAHPAHVVLLTAALRSDRFRQGTGHLTINPGTSEVTNCCLGVACIVAMENGLQLDYVDHLGDYRNYLQEPGHECSGEDRETCECYTNDTTLPQAVVEWYGFGDDDPMLNVTLTDGSGRPFKTRKTAATLNDEELFTFAQIADAFDANFVHPKESDGDIVEP